MAGHLICVEGLDHAGKTTLCKKLINHLNSPNSAECYFGFPDRTTIIGKIIDRYLKKEVELPKDIVHLLFTANRLEKQNEIVGNLLRGRHVILDRYLYSGIAYSTAVGLDLQWCKKQEEDLLKPTCVIFLHANASTLRKRNGFGEELFETENIQEKAKRVYLDNLLESNWYQIDTSILNEEEVFKEAKAYVDEYIKNREFIWKFFKS